MKRSKLDKLQTTEWYKPLDNDELEVELVPSAAMYALQGGPFAGGNPVDPQLKVARVCNYVFTNFRGLFEDDGEKTENTVAVRAQIYAHPTIQQSIDLRLATLVAAVLRKDETSGEEESVEGSD